MRAASVSLGLILALVRPAFADDKDKLLGTWKIVSARTPERLSNSPSYRTDDVASDKRRA